MLFTYMTVPDNNKFLAGQPFQANRSARMELVGADPDFGAETVLKSIREPGRGIDHD